MPQLLELMIESVLAYLIFFRFQGDPIDHYVFKDSNKLGGVVRVPLPRRSLLVMTGEPRYQWEHAILRRDINSRRVVIAYRELTPTYLPGGKEESIGKLILEQAERFF